MFRHVSNIFVGATNRQNQRSHPLRYPGLAVMVVAGVIHLLALSGVLGTERLTLLCKLAPKEPNLDILMQHRRMLALQCAEIARAGG